MKFGYAEILHRKHKRHPAKHRQSRMSEVKKAAEKLPHRLAAGKQRYAVQRADSQTDPKKDLQHEPVKRKDDGTDQVLNRGIPKAAGYYKRMAVLLENRRLLVFI